MKKALLFLALAALPSIVFAHGGVAQNVGRVTVFLKQNPISPLVGEKVSMHFAFSTKDTNQPLANLEVELKVIDTFTGDESRDVVVLEEQQKTDANGNFTFEYSFPKENFFDIELTFSDPGTGREETTGFLIQPRQNRHFTPYSVGLIVVAFVLGYGLSQQRRKT